jgi:4-hydroxyphenylpyruvate dioxygenase-like putative hemolysin
MNPNAPQREAIQASDNPIGMDGIEFIEYATSKPQALGQVLEMMGFRPIARHRSREVMLYRQGGVNLIVNAHHSLHSQSTAPDEQPVIAAMALRVRDAAVAYQRALDLGAWAVPTRVEVMELNIPAIHGVGQSRIYFVDRHRVFSIYDVDFVPIPGVDQHPPAQHGLHLFGLVQYIGNERTADWTEFYQARCPALWHLAQRAHLAQPVQGLSLATDRARTQRARCRRRRAFPAPGLGLQRRGRSRGQLGPSRCGICRACPTPCTTRRCVDPQLDGLGQL